MGIAKNFRLLPQKRRNYSFKAILVSVKITSVILGLYRNKNKSFLGTSSIDVPNLNKIKIN